MANRIGQILSLWQPQKDELQWVLATIIGTEGSSYRKSGAMMMINSLGQYHGLLSGGCLESDIMRQSRRCWESGQNRIIQYDMREEEDLAWQLGIGCGGLVRILLQPVDQHNHYLMLDQLMQIIDLNQFCYYQQSLNEQVPKNTLTPLKPEQVPQFIQLCEVAETQGIQTLRQLIRPAPHMAVFGGGVDARPLVAMAADLGWQVSLVDPRTSYAREGHFTGADRIVKQAYMALSHAEWLQQIDMAVIMTHNVKLDGEALALVQSSSARYVGLLGPIHRTERVLASVGMQRSDLVKPLANPVGLRLGGELPESIALSIVSEAHAFIEQTDARSISGMLI